MPEKIDRKKELISFLYTHILKPLLFLCDPELVHDSAVKVGTFLGTYTWLRRLTAWFFFYNNPKLEQTIHGIHFANPIGLAAGFDKNGELTDILPSVGFGYSEVGSVTGESCSGNPKPRLWRLPHSRGLLVYYGLKNDGAAAIAERLGTKKFSIPIGISVAKTNSVATVEDTAGIADYVKAYKAFAGIADYFTINISCPNAFGGQPFTDPLRLDKLLTAIDAVRSPQPIFLKLSPDITTENIDAIIKVAHNHSIQGFICTNLTKNRNNSAVQDILPSDNGGMSGKIVEDLSDKLISYLYTKVGNEFTIIGCGGVFNAQDAYRKIKLGAKLVQLITGMIYEGPTLIGTINHGLVQLLRRDGYDTISQAVGVNTHQNTTSSPQ